MGNPAGRPMPLDLRLEREERFVTEYLKDFNATAAYLRMFPGVERRTARNAGSNMLCRDRVRELIRQATKDRLQPHDVNEDRVLLELARLALYDPRKLLRPVTQPADDGAERVVGHEVVPLAELPEDIARAVRKITHGAAGLTLELADKGQALIALARLMGIGEAGAGRTAPGARMARELDVEGLDDDEIDALIAEEMEAQAEDAETIDMGEDGGAALDDDA